MARIKAPNSEYNGRIGEVIFRDGVAETDDIAVIAYCRGAGYEVDGTTDNPAEGTPTPADPREVTEDQLGTRLRDAAVDPKPGDFLPPSNAGQANPHGPDVVAPGIHAVSGPGPIVPGAVLDDPDAQAARETEAAARTLAGDEPVPDVTADMAKQSEADQSEADRIAGEPPAGNASQADWADWVIATHPGIDEAEVRAMKRDELREQYGPKAE